VHLYAPRSSSLCQQFTAWLTGNPPEFFDSKFVAQDKGREGTQVSSSDDLQFDDRLRIRVSEPDVNSHALS